MARLGDVCNIKGGYAFKSEEFSNIGVPVVRIGNITEKGLEIDNEICFDETFWNENKNYRVNKNDVLIAMSGATVGKSCINTFSDKLLLNQRVAAISTKQESDNKYIYYCVSSPAFMTSILNQSVGCAQPNISKKQLSDIELYLPPLEEQDDIVGKFDKICNLISFRKQQLSKLDELVKSRFIEMFGNPITNSKSLRSNPLKDVLVLKAGDFTAASDISDEPTAEYQYPCYGGNGIRGYVAEYNQEGTYSLIGRQGALSGNVQYAKGRFKNTEHALLVTPTVEMNSIWLNQLLINLDLKRYQTGAAQPGLSVKNLQEIPIISVLLSEQEAFATFVEQTDKLKFEVKESLEKLETLKKALMQKYFG